MLHARTCTAVCWRDGSSWVVHVPELGRTAQAARLSQVEGVARGLVTVFTSDDPATYRVVVELRVRHSVTELVEAAAALRADRDRVSVEAVTMRRGLARRLAAEGFDVRDVAALLGLSYGRALQLVGEQGHGPRSSRLPTAERRAARLPAQRQPSPPPQTATLPDEDLDERNGVTPHRSYRHEAFLYRGQDEFLAETLSFVEDAVALGQPVMVAVAAERLALLRSAMPDTAPVYWVDMAELGGNPARIIPAWRQFVDEHGAGQVPVRGVGEPVWPGRRPAEVVECQLHEALLNLAIGPDTPLWLRCPYDADALDADVLEEASRSHPALVEGEQYRGSLLYGGADHADHAFRDELPEPPEPVEELLFDDGSFAAVRPAVLSGAAAAGLSAARSADLALAVTEAATNSLRHGGRRGGLRVWEQDGALLCEVRDAGRIEDPLVGRRVPSLESEGGRGLWLVNHLSDLVQVRSSERGVAVRVLTWL